MNIFFYWANLIEYIQEWHGINEIKRNGCKEICFVLLLLLRILGLLTLSLVLYPNVLADTSFSLHHVFCVELKTILNKTLYLNHRVNSSNSVNHDQVQVLSCRKYSFLVLPVVRIEPATSRRFNSESPSNQTPYLLRHVSLPDVSVNAIFP